MLGRLRRSAKPRIAQSIRETLGTPRLVDQLPSSPRSRVWLVEFDGAPAVVKQIVGGSDADDRHAREVSALRLASGVRPPVVPALLAVDAASRVLVMEHLTRSPLPRAWAIEYASALARLHKATDSSNAEELPAWKAPDESDVDAFLGLAKALAVRTPPDLSTELGRLLDRLQPVGHHALLHGDPCPDNTVQTAEGLRMLDVEQAALGDGMIELAYLRMAFPTCWCVTELPQPLLDAAERTYRDTWQSITGAPPEGDIADACAAWLLRGDALVERARRGSAEHLALLPSKDWRWGTATARQRILHRLEAVAAVGADRDQLRTLVGVSRSMHERMAQRWPRLGPLPDHHVQTELGL